MRTLPLNKPYFDSEELKEIQKVLDSGWVSQGPKVKEFENKITNFLGINYAVAVSNCTSALHLGLLSIGINEADEVLVSDFTFPATGHSVLYCRAKPIFVDVDLITYNINSELIEENITDKTKAIIPVHTFGQPADMDPIMEIAKDYNLKVIEDAACALGAKYKNKFAGTIGDLGCFSFHGRKEVTTGEGGMVVTNNQTLVDKIRRLSVFGRITEYSNKSGNSFISKFIDVGYNYKMSDITAAVGVAQMEKLNKIIKRKRALAKYWDEKLQEIEYIEPPYVSENTKHIYQSYVALVDRCINRNKLIEALMKKGIQTQIGTYASHIQPVYNSNQKCPNSLEIFNRSVALPIYYMLRKGDIDIAATILKNTLKDLRRV